MRFSGLLLFYVSSTTSPPTPGLCELSAIILAIIVNNPVIWIAAFATPKAAKLSPSQLVHPDACKGEKKPVLPLASDLMTHVIVPSVAM